jgi:hypothetical protein
VRSRGKADTLSTLKLVRVTTPPKTILAFTVFNSSDLDIVAAQRLGVILQSRRIIMASAQAEIPIEQVESSRSGNRSRRGGRGGGGGRPQPREMIVSKALSKLLRHDAEKCGLKLDGKGYANVADVVITCPPHFAPCGSDVS